MKIIYIGTAASEGLPALFCRCEVCETARKLGGESIRGRSGVCINDILLIDFPPDIYYGAIRAGVYLPGIRDIVVTHTHEDHFDAYELATRRTPVYCSMKNGGNTKLNIFGNMRSGEWFSKYLPGSETGYAENGSLIFKYSPLFVPIETAAGVTVTPLAADHDMSQECRILLLQEKSSGTAFLFGHDTGLIPNESIEYLMKLGVKLSLVSLDCTNVMLEGERNHMGLAADIKMKNLLSNIGLTDNNTRFLINHFSHNGFIAKDKIWTLEEFKAEAGQSGFEVTYDTMKIEL